MRHALGSSRIVAVAVILVSMAARLGANEPHDLLVCQEIRSADGDPIARMAPAGGALALVFLSAECPISNAYSPTLDEIARAFPPETFTMIGVFVDPDRSDAQVRDHAKEFALSFMVANDPEGRLAEDLGVTVTPEVVVVDDRGRVRYLGRIDDQYLSRRKANANPATHELRDAIADVIAGRDVAAPKVEAIGCPLPEFQRSKPDPK